MSKRTIRFLLEDILEAILNIEKYTNQLSFDDFMSDQKTIDAVVRNFEIIGEAANKLPNDFRSNNPIIDWTGVIGFRNILIHDYFGTDYDILWNIKNNYLPILKTGIYPLITQNGV